MTDDVWHTQLNIFTLWPFPGKVCFPLSRMECSELQQKEQVAQKEEKQALLGSTGCGQSGMVCAA